jgi:hypothetical protein
MVKEFLFEMALINMLVNKLFYPIKPTNYTYRISSNGKWSACFILRMQNTSDSAVNLLLIAKLIETWSLNSCIVSKH